MSQILKLNWNAFIFSVLLKQSYVKYCHFKTRLVFTYKKYSFKANKPVLVLKRERNIYLKYVNQRNKILRNVSISKIFLILIFQCTFNVVQCDVLRYDLEGFTSVIKILRQITVILLYQGFNNFSGQFWEKSVTRYSFWYYLRAQWASVLSSVLWIIFRILKISQKMWIQIFYLRFFFAWLPII